MRVGRIRDAALAAAVVVSMGLTASAAPADASLLHPTPASIGAQEQKRWTSDLRRDSARTSVSEFALLLRCVEGLSLGRTQDAINNCSEAIALDPRNPAGYKLRGMANFGEGNFILALRDLDIAVALDPSDAEIQSARGAVFRAQGETDSAVEAYSRAIALQPADSRWWNARCWTRAIARERLRLALADCNKAISLDPHFAMAFDSRGLVYLQLSRYAEAIRDYTRALALRTMAPSLFGRGAAKLRRGDASGHWDIERARATDPNIDQTFRHYGIVVDIPFGRTPANPQCKGTCPPSRPSPKQGPPIPPNVRSVSIDLDHGKARAGP